MHRPTKNKRIPIYREGDLVRIKRNEEIGSTLDPASKREGCPFTTQMAEYSGKEFKIIKTVKNFFDEHECKMYKVVPPLYILEGLICDGQVKSFTQRCDHSCYLLWHEDWLEKVDGPDANGGVADTADPYLQKGEDPTPNGPQKSEQFNSGCQLMSIKDVAEYNPWYENLFQSKIKLIWSAKKTLNFLKNRLLDPIGLKNGKPIATSISQDELVPGDIVRVKLREEILALLDDWGRTKGCVFTPEMFNRCGQRYRVLKQVHYFYDEVKERICRCRDMVLLEGAVCSGQRRLFPSDCDRNCFQFWHVSWLEKEG